MDKLIALPYQLGQPLRPEDWDLIQGATKGALSDVIKAFTATESVILWGLTVSSQGGQFTVTEGAIYTDREIFYVPGATFTTSVEKQIYLQSNITEEESRTFKDTSTHNVWQLRAYQLGYAVTIPQGAIAYLSIERLSSLQADLIFSYMDQRTKLVNLQSLTYANCFSTATGFNYAKLVGNGLNQYMLIAAFHSTVVNGLMTTLPSGLRPRGDIVGTFVVPGPSVGILSIKENGQVWVYGCSIVGINYITFQFPLSFDDAVGYDVPTGVGQG